MSSILTIGDLHEPFAHRDSLQFVKSIADYYEIDRVIFMGDEIDAYWASTYVKSPEALSAKAEHKAALKALSKWYEVFPEADICESNHTIRPYKRAIDAGILKEFLKGYKEILKAPEGWNWYEKIIADEVLYIHGEGFSGIYAHRNAAVTYMCSVVIGHLHAHAGIQYVDTDNGSIWGMNVGCLVDLSTYAFAYSKFMRYRPSLGVGIVVDGTPYWEPMKLKRSGRWAGL